jgi:DNA-binding CsgD family transcriptional regulator
VCRLKSRGGVFVNLEFELKSGLGSSVSGEFANPYPISPGKVASMGNDPGGFDSARDGAVVLGIDRSVLLFNDFANTICGRADGLTLVGGRFRALRSSDDLLLQKLIAQALSNTGGGTMPLARSGGGRHYFIVVKALPRRQLDVMDKMPAVLVTIADPDCIPEPSPYWLTRLFALTTAEARLAMLLFAGSTLSEASSALGIAQATARVHLAHIFRKTRTARQAELIRLLMSYPWDELDPNEGQTALAS